MKIHYTIDIFSLMRYMGRNKATARGPALSRYGPSV
jgi:hypothetical protein